MNTRTLPAVRGDNGLRSVDGTPAEIRHRIARYSRPLEPVSMELLPDGRYRAIVRVLPPVLPARRPAWQRAAAISTAVAVPVGLVALAVWWVMAHLALIAAGLAVLAVAAIVGGPRVCTTIVKVVHFH